MPKHCVTQGGESLEQSGTQIPRSWVSGEELLLPSAAAVVSTDVQSRYEISRKMVKTPGTR